MLEITTDVRFHTRGFAVYRLDVRRRLEQLVHRYCRLIAARAKTLAPVDTGRLRAQIRVVLRGLVGYVLSGVTYALYQELGTRLTNGTPHLRPALRHYGRRFWEAVLQLLGRR